MKENVKSKGMKKIFLLFLPLFILGQVLLAQEAMLVKPYLQYATKDAITVLWETSSPASTILKYGEAQLNAKAPNLSVKKELQGTRLLHEVRLNNLKVHTKYMYQVVSVLENGEQIESKVYTFSTAVKDQEAFYFAFIGDTQENKETPQAWGQIAQLIYGKRPNFIINAGDLVDDGLQKFHWTERFFPKGHIAMSRFPMFTVLGNHERDSPLYYEYMANPPPEYYYTFKYGNAQFFMIDTNRDVSEGSEQYNWLEGALAESKATWKFVVHHHPPYSSEENDHGDSWIGKSTKGTNSRNLVPLYETYGVDFCLFGHTHVYERTWPLFKDVVNMKKGVIYINSGGAGGGLEDFDPVRSWFTQELHNKHHYCTFSIYEDHLSFKATDIEGRLFDTFQMKKEKGKLSIIQPPPPLFKYNGKVFIETAKVRLTTRTPANTTYYTLDGSEPTEKSLRYEEAIEVSKNTIIKARSFDESGRASRVVVLPLQQMDPLPSSKVRTRKKGLQYKYYEGSWDKLPDFNNLKAAVQGQSMAISEGVVQDADDHFGLVFEGYLNIKNTDVYSFYLGSDDGSKLYIDGKLLIDNDEEHAMTYKQGDLALESGQHKIRIEYFENTGGQGLSVGFTLGDGTRRPFFPGNLSH